MRISYFFPSFEFYDFTVGYKKRRLTFSQPNLIWNVAGQDEERMKMAGRRIFFD